MDIIQKRTIMEKDGEILMPVADIAYSIREERVFNGDVVPIPNVLIEYFDKMELKAFSLIFRHQRKHGSCIIRQKKMAEYMGCSEVSVLNTIRRMEKMGIVRKERLSGDRKRYNKSINFETIQALNDFVKDMKPGAASALREKMGDCNIMEIPKQVVQQITAIYSWHEDPAEDEEYTFAHKFTDQ